MKKIQWKQLALEFLSIYVAVLSAFALNNWNENRKDALAESKILLEIYNGLAKDLNDIDLNISGHEQGLEACKFWRDIVNHNETKLDRLPNFYLELTRDFTSIQNTSGYETLKSKGFELIENDSLRSKIISLYEYDYQTLRKLEEEYHELQFQESYFSDLNTIIAPNFQFDDKGNMIGLRVPFNLSPEDKNKILSILWKIQVNRNFVMGFYDQVKKDIQVLQQEIQEELNP